MEAGRAFLRSAARGRTVLACDRDVDGLSAAVLVRRALARLGASAAMVLPASKGEHVHRDALRARIRALSPESLVVLDMGSRGEPILPGLPTLLIDHHQPSGFPPGAVVVSGYGHEPVASTSLLALELVRPLVPADDLAWLGLLGTVADLGSPAAFPSLAAVAGRHGRGAVAESVALLNAARRAEDHDVALALEVLERAPGPEAIAQGAIAGVEGLRRARVAVQAELGRWARTPPRVRGRFAVFRISSRAQIHPLLAVRWKGRLKKQIVLVANDGYIPGRVNFAMRTQLPVNLVELLRAVPLGEVDGEWGHGHPAATGGSLPPPAFECLLVSLGAVEPPAEGAAITAPI